MSLVILVLVLTTGGVVFTLNYEGEEFCQDTTAWPDTPFLGQMHPYHVTHYSQHAASIGVEPCEGYALDQRYGAVRGLRELGYTVFGPGEFAWPQLPPLAAVDPDSLTCRTIAGFGDGAGMMHLLRGVHTIRTTFGGWNEAPFASRWWGQTPCRSRRMTGRSTSAALSPCRRRRRVATSSPCRPLATGN